MRGSFELALGRFHRFSFFVVFSFFFFLVCLLRLTLPSPRRVAGQLLPHTRPSRIPPLFLCSCRCRESVGRHLLQATAKGDAQTDRPEQRSAAQRQPVGQRLTSCNQCGAAADDVHCALVLKTSDRSESKQEGQAAANGRGDRIGSRRSSRPNHSAPRRSDSPHSFDGADGGGTHGASIRARYLDRGMQMAWRPQTTPKGSSAWIAVARTPTGLDRHATATIPIRGPHRCLLPAQLLPPVSNPHLTHPQQPQWISRRTTEADPSSAVRHTESHARSSVRSMAIALAQQPASYIQHVYLPLMLCCDCSRRFAMGR